ncbi:MAG TPA: UDP-N-acetylmuramoyl-L-alanine--D-glutamate ligase [Leucothrix sp.]|nr:UDP-N-acetylmuramoyl-L-alanine--D-glutamate ligase [Leucothrix sp.]
MNTQIQKIESVIVGLGTTGLSVARYLMNQQSEHQHGFAVVDSRENPPGADELKNQYTDVPYHFGDFDTPWFDSAKQLVVNPGIAIATAEIQQAQQAGVQIIGDIELFARHVAKEKNDSKPVIAITGSNGKTTVTDLLDLMAQKSGIKVGTGGNIGTAALDLLSNEETELFILELSSYQLETTPSLQTLAAVILNLSEDHLDRYNNNFEEYAQAKAVIYHNCEHIICNREDAHSLRFAKQAAGEKAITSFGLNEPETGVGGSVQYGLRYKDGISWLAKGNELLMPSDDIKLPGQHNIANALAALALGEVAGLKLSAMLSAIREYDGMAHRTQLLTELKGVSWYNDSKGTNVGATLAALSGLPGKTVLIAGGQGKGADFLSLGNAIKRKARAVVLMGEDANQIASVVDASVPTIFVKSMSEAVSKAYQLARGDEQDNVLLSPACASFDMFKNYVVRGEIFIDEVRKLEKNIMGSIENA